MKIDRRRLAPASLALALLCAGLPAPQPEDGGAGCFCEAPCRCCPPGTHDGGRAMTPRAASPTAHGGTHDAGVFCALRRHDDATPAPEAQLTPTAPARDAVFASRAALPHPAVEGRPGRTAFFLPASLPLPPEVPPPRPAG